MGPQAGPWIIVFARVYGQLSWLCCCTGRVCTYTRCCEKKRIMCCGKRRYLGGERKVEIIVIFDVSISVQNQESRKIKRHLDLSGKSRFKIGSYLISIFNTALQSQLLDKLRDTIIFPAACLVKASPSSTPLSFRLPYIHLDCPPYPSSINTHLQLHKPSSFHVRYVTRLHINSFCASICLSIHSMWPGALLFANTRILHLFNVCLFRSRSR